MKKYYRKMLFLSLLLVFVMIRCSDSNEPNGDTFTPLQTAEELRNMLLGEWECTGTMRSVYDDTYSVTSYTVDFRNTDTAAVHWYELTIDLLTQDTLGKNILIDSSTIIKNNSGFYGKFPYKIMTRDTIQTPHYWSDVYYSDPTKNASGYTINHQIIFYSKDSIELKRFVPWLAQPLDGSCSYSYSDILLKRKKL